MSTEYTFTDVRTRDDNGRFKPKQIEQPQAQHSPLPWKANADTIWRNVGGREAEIVCHPINHPQSIADARLIVASVNHAAKLAEALRELVCAGMTASRAIAMRKAEKALAAYESEVRQ